MPKAYSRAQVVLHWVVFALVTLQYILSPPIAEAWSDIRAGIEPAIEPPVIGHVIGGLVVLALVVWRLILRSRRGVPPPPDTQPAALRMAAHVTHWALYAALILLPITGAAAWFGGVEAAAGAHSVLRIVLLALIVLHVAGALYHQFWVRDGLMARMGRPK